MKIIDYSELGYNLVLPGLGPLKRIVFSSTALAALAKGSTELPSPLLLIAR